MTEWLFYSCVELETEFSQDDGADILEVPNVMKIFPTEKKQKQKLKIGSNLQLEIIVLSEVSQKEKDKYHMISLICGI